MVGSQSKFLLQAKKRLRCTDNDGASLYRHSLLAHGMIAVFKFCAILILSVLFTTPSSAEPQASADQIKAWINELNSDNYFERRLATENLILTGKPVIKPIFESVQTGSLETIARGMHVLRELALTQDSDSEVAAFHALEKLAAKRVTLAARLLGSSECGSVQMARSSSRVSSCLRSSREIR